MVDTETWTRLLFRLFRLLLPGIYQPDVLFAVIAAVGTEFIEDGCFVLFMGFEVTSPYSLQVFSFCADGHIA